MFINLPNYKSTTISEDKFKVHCLRNDLSKIKKNFLGFIITFTLLALVAPIDDEKCLARGVAHACTHSNHYNSVALLARAVNASSAKTYDLNFKNVSG